MRILSIGIVLWMFSCPFFALLGVHSEIPNDEGRYDNLLKTTFNDESCTNPCWLGIEVGVSSRQSVEQLLHEEGLNYNTEGDYTYHVSLENDSPLWSGVSNPIGDIHISGDDDTVHAMSFSLDLCISTVIEAYDKYPEVEQADGTLYLLYPAHGLIYWLNLETERIYGVFLYPLERFVGQDGERQPWSDVADGFHRILGDCVDALSQS